MINPAQSLGSQTLARISHDINVKGYCCLEGFIDNMQLMELRAHVVLESMKHQNQYYAHHGSCEIGPQLTELGTTTEVTSLLSGLYLQSQGEPAHSDQIYQVLRCVQGSAGRRESNAFHYDASLVTALLPIEIPQDGDECGDLILFANRRKVRRSAIWNALEKMALQNPVTRRLIVLGIALGWLRPQRLRLVPGNLYLFWGYRSLHANEPCAPAHRRATALFHYGDPHAGSLTTRLILQLTQRRARLRSAKGSQPAL